MSLLSSFACLKLVKSKSEELIEIYRLGLLEKGYDFLWIIAPKHTSIICFALTLNPPWYRSYVPSLSV